jgi:HupE / UreJ protein
MLAVLALALLGTSLVATAARAHDVPSRIDVRVFAKPEGDRLDVAARVPLILISQFDLPKRGPGYLELDRIDASLDRAANDVAAELIPFYEGDKRLEAVAVEHRISLPSEDAFRRYEQAIGHIGSEDLPSSADVFWNQGFFDIHFTFPISAEDADLSVDPNAPSGVGDSMEVLVQFVSPDGPARTFRLDGLSDSVALDPGWFQAARTFVESGVVHILGGLDHLLFLFCLVLPIRNLRRLLPVVTSFTVAHSIALIASAQGWVPAGEWFPPLVEATIAGSIVYMAIENVIAPDLRRRWIVTGVFGVVHGFGFSYGLQEEFQLAGDHLLTALFSFNLGVEIGQVLVLAVTVPALVMLFRVPNLAKFGVVVASVLIGHTGWHWFMDRVAIFPSLEWPTIDEAMVAASARALVIIMLGGAVIYGLARRTRARPRGEAAPRVAEQA